MTGETKTKIYPAKIFKRVETQSADISQKRHKLMDKTSCESQNAWYSQTLFKCKDEQDSNK